MWPCLERPRLLTRLSTSAGDVSGGRAEASGRQLDAALMAKLAVLGSAVPSIGVRKRLVERGVNGTLSALRFLTRS